MKTVYSITYHVYDKNGFVTSVEIGAQTLKEALKEKRDLERELIEIYDATAINLDKVTQKQEDGSLYSQDMKQFPIYSCI